MCLLLPAQISSFDHVIGFLCIVGLIMNRKYCEHCQDYVSLHAFKMHKLEFYNAQIKQWMVRRTVNTNDSAKEAFLEMCNVEDDRLITGNS